MDKSFMLDSGAFSAWTKGVDVDILAYCNYIKSLGDRVDVYASLDVIGDPEATWANLLIMQEQGLHPFPTFHVGSDPKYLLQMMNAGHDFIALGGMVGMHRKQLHHHLNILFRDYICDRDGVPRVKVHGFGLSAIPTIIKYPWFSVDATTWVKVSRFGGGYIPRMDERGHYDFTVDPFKVDFSARPKTPDDMNYHNGIGPALKGHIDAYLEEMRIPIGTFHIEDGKEVEDSPGCSTRYVLRDVINVLFYMNLEKTLPPWNTPHEIPAASPFAMDNRENTFRTSKFRGDTAPPPRVYLASANCIQSRGIHRAIGVENILESYWAVLKGGMKLETWDFFEDFEIGKPTDVLAYGPQGVDYDND